jgi:hypothetical protein
MTTHETAGSKFSIVFEKRERILQEDAYGNNKTDDDAIDELRRFSEHVAAEPVIYFTRC